MKSNFAFGNLPNKSLLQKMKSLIEILSSPHIVAQFQRVCGLQWKYPDTVSPIFPRLSEHEENKDAFTIKSKFMLRIMQIGSELAGEPFYYTFLPVCSWVLDIGVARKTLTSLALIMYIGQSAKVHHSSFVWKQILCKLVVIP